MPPTPFTTDQPAQAPTPTPTDFADATGTPLPPGITPTPPPPKSRWSRIRTRFLIFCVVAVSLVPLGLAFYGNVTWSTRTFAVGDEALDAYITASGCREVDSRVYDRGSTLGYSPYVLTVVDCDQRTAREICQAVLQAGGFVDAGMCSLRRQHALTESCYFSDYNARPQEIKIPEGQRAVHVTCDPQFSLPKLP
ncbi:hypothetical protein BGO17_01440 [Candidatus Saccharibacteria bacterium 49-20]|nr:MAG: hypothetical protein BGO17_01440 [Candidatus Saccharibacteria bacterium 49-20]